MYVSQKAANHSFKRSLLYNTYTELRNTVVLNKIKYIARVSLLDSAPATTRVRNDLSISRTQATKNSYHSSAVMLEKFFEC